ncbi:hypothetical protein ACQEVI_02860 [Promicromonospora sp. CA-289599]|uniref:hypothetical protein n=1 Tax=Promicromonospora sp. CA-289599 TaxID=3240014 RepID=UPI003D8BAE17
MTSDMTSDMTTDMTSNDVEAQRTGVRAVLPGPVSRIACGLLLVAVVIRVTGDVDAWDDGGFTVPLVAHLLLLPLLALTLWAAAPSSGGALRPRPVVLTLVALALGYLGDVFVTTALFPGAWDALTSGMELEGLVYLAMVSGAVLALALVVQVVAFRGWLGAGPLRSAADVTCWVTGVAAAAVLVAGVAHVDLGEYVVGAVVAGSAWVAAVSLLAVVAWRADRLAGVGALLHVAAAGLLLVGTMASGVGAAVSLRAVAVTYVVGQALLAVGVLRRLRGATPGADLPL